MDSPNDKRTSIRVPVGFRVKIMSDEKDILCPSALNLSSRGVLVATRERLPIGTGCYVILFVQEEGEETRILAWGIVVRDAPEGMAIRFTKILGDHGTELLKELVAFKSGDPDRAKREFEAFVKPPKP